VDLPASLLLAGFLLSSPGFCANAAAVCPCSTQYVPLLDAARISSQFGQRIDPILHLPEFHSGIDLTASFGTPIHIVAAGVIEEAGRKGAYGLYARIRHSESFETAFAHLAAFADGVRPGTMLQPGDLLGVVGSTGRSTGPHVHIEALFKGIPVNPICVPPAVPKPAFQPKPKAPRRSVARKSKKRK